MGRRLGGVRPSRTLLTEVPIQYYVFDLLGLEGEDLRGPPYRARGDLLAQLDLESKAGPIVVPPYYREVPIETMLAVAAENGVEGVVAKRLDSAYQAGRSKLWRKLPLRKSAEVIIVGWLESARGSDEFAGAVGEDVSFALVSKLFRCAPGATPSVKAHGRRPAYEVDIGPRAGKLGL